MFKKGFLVLSLLFMAALFGVQAQDGTLVRVAHLAPDAPAVDVFLDGERILTGVEFAQVSNWLPLAAGDYTLSVVASGDTQDNAVLGPLTLSLASGDWTTVIAHGLLETNALAAQVIVQDLTTIPESETRISAFHGVLGLESVQVAVDDTVLVNGLMYPAGEADGFAEQDIVVGTYNVTIRDNAGTVLLDLGSPVLGSQRDYFVAAIGTPESPSFIFVTTQVNEVLAAMGEEATTPEIDEQAAMPETVETGAGPLRLRLAHFSVSAPEIDVYIDGELTIEGLDFPDVTDYIDISAGTYTVSIVPEGASISAAVLEQEIALVEETVTLLAAVGFPEDESLALTTVIEDSSTLADGEARLAFFQGIPSLAEFDLLLNGTPIVQGATFPGVREENRDGFVSLDVIPDTYDFDVASDSLGLTMDVGLVGMGPGRQYLIASLGTELAPTFVVISMDAETLD